MSRTSFSTYSQTQIHLTREANLKFLTFPTQLQRYAEQIRNFVHQYCKSISQQLLTATESEYPFYYCHSYTRKATKISSQVYINDKIPNNLYLTLFKAQLSLAMSVYQYAVVAIEMVLTKVYDFTSLLNEFDQILQSSQGCLFSSCSSSVASHRLSTGQSDKSLDQTPPKTHNRPFQSCAYLEVALLVYFTLLLAKLAVVIS